jgi:hypothetical protein
VRNDKRNANIKGERKMLSNSEFLKYVYDNYEEWFYNEKEIEDILANLGNSDIAMWIREYDTKRIDGKISPTLTCEEYFMSEGAQFLKPSGDEEIYE